MGLNHFPGQKQGIQLLQRSLERGRLAHAYLFTGQDIDELEALATALAKVLNCLERSTVAGIDSCDKCSQCRKIEMQAHPDVHYVRPESKTRVITVDQLRDVLQEIYLKPNEASHKVFIIVAADRMNEKAANAFLKTLEEPPPNSILILLTAEPQRLLDTILSRCLRLNFPGTAAPPLDPARAAWLQALADAAAAGTKSLLGRYRLLDVLLAELARIKGAVDEQLSARSPLERHPDAEPALREKWEDELKASIEAEYRRQRGELLGLVHWWLRDVWLEVLRTKSDSGGNSLLRFGELAGTGKIAARINLEKAVENLAVIEQLQRSLHTNVQEALAIEVSLLKLHL
jgi:DNA polymerase-3 subunit delta'